MPKPPTKVFIVVFPGFQLLDATGPAQVFATANDEADDAQQRRPYAVRMVSMGGGTVASSSGIAVCTEVLPGKAALRGATVLVSGGHGVHEAARHTKLITWIKRAHASTQRCGSVCSGAFLLAQAGLLDHKRAVTHWLDVQALRAHFPAVRVQDDALFIKDGSLYTSAGVTAGIDLSLSLGEEDLGRDTPMTVAKLPGV